MTKQDAAEFASIMAGLAESLGSELSEAGLKIYFCGLQEYSIEEVRQAATAIFKTRKFTKMPTGADFIEFITGGSVDDVANVEAAKVWQAIVDHGAYSNICFDDATTQAVVKQCFGGWTRLCAEMMIDQQKWFIKEFIAYYGAYSRQKVKHYGALPGLASGDVKLVGDKLKAQAVLEAGKPLAQLEGSVEGVALPAPEDAIDIEVAPSSPEQALESLRKLTQGISRGASPGE